MRFLPHEPDSARTLASPPVAVRRKLAESGASLDGPQWRSLPLVARRRLFEIEVETRLQRIAFAHLIRWLKGTFLGLDTPAPAIEEAVDVPWRRELPPESSGVPSAAWRVLDVDARFALLVAESEEERRHLLGVFAATVQSA